MANSQNFDLKFQETTQGSHQLINGKNPDFKWDTTNILDELRQEGQNVDNLARKLDLQRQISDALHDHEDLEELQRRKREQRRYWNETDDFFGPKHPLKKKYRLLNSQAT